MPLHFLTVSLRLPSWGITVAGKDPLLASPFVHYYSDRAFEPVGSSDSNERAYKLAVTGIKVAPFAQVQVDMALDTMVTDE